MNKNFLILKILNVVGLDWISKKKKEVRKIISKIYLFFYIE